MYRLLFCGVLLASSVQATPTTPAPTSNDKLRQFMEQVRPQPSASQAGGNAVRAAAKVTPEQLQERADLLKKGEAALASMQLEPALMAFERAANILHAADTEIALVRTYMQYGQYRRALASGAHTAGAHLDVVGGSALYAWLLHLGAQTAVAQRLMAETEGRMPGNKALAQVQRQLSSGQPVATGDMLNPPTRLAPYGFAQGIPAAARVVGSAVLLHSGKQALVPLALLPKAASKFWLRNGMGGLPRPSNASAGWLLDCRQRALPRHSWLCGGIRGDAGDCQRRRPRLAVAAAGIFRRHGYSHRQRTRTGHRHARRPARRTGV